MLTELWNTIAAGKQTTHGQRARQAMDLAHQQGGSTFSSAPPVVYRATRSRGLVILEEGAKSRRARSPLNLIYAWQCRLRATAPRFGKLNRMSDLQRLAACEQLRAICGHV
jgi:hypothetical protein